MPVSLFLSRSRKPGHLLEWKVGVFTAGAAMALMGIYFELRWMTGAAIVVLVAGALLRLPSGPDTEEAREPASSEEEGDQQE